RVACVALEWIALEEAPSAADTDRLLGDRDDRALHGDVRRPGALDRLERSIDLGLRNCSVVDRAGGLDREEHLRYRMTLRRDLGMRDWRARHHTGKVSEGAVVGRLHEPEESRGEAQEEV